MMSRRHLGATLALLLLASAAVGVARSARPVPPVDPSSSARTAAQPDMRGSLLLTVEIDTRGVRVLQVTRKSGLAFRAPRHADDMAYRWRVVDPAGVELASGGFDPGRICTDAAHSGRPPHVEGDQIVPHIAHVNVKVPDVSGAARFEFRRRVDGHEVVCGSTSIDTVGIR